MQALVQSNPHRLPATPKGLYISGWCSTGYHANGRETAYKFDATLVCKFELPNPTYARTIKCACPCHWPTVGRIDHKDKTVGSLPEPEPELRTNPSPYFQFLTKKDREKEAIKIDGTMPTYDGRRKRGGLEEQVRAVCLRYKGEDKLTPSLVAKSIEATTGKRPSSGAIAAVFVRWEEREIAVFTHSPQAFNRFL